MLNLTRLHLGSAHESQFQGLGISPRPCSGRHLEWRQQGLVAPPAVELHREPALRKGSMPGAPTRRGRPVWIQSVTPSRWPVGRIFIRVGAEPWALSFSRGTKDIGVRFDSKTNGTGTLRQFVSKATRPKLPGGLLLSSVCPACLVQGTAERPGSGEGRVTSCTARRARPRCRASWPLIRFPSPLK
jgi:hypothetical protein